ncbi:unnamed protein product [Brassica oleracea var. botrytis]
MEKVTEIAESQQVGKNSTEGDEAAGLLENISVEDKKSEEKAKEDDKGKSPGKEEKETKEEKEEQKKKDEHLKTSNPIVHEACGCCHHKLFGHLALT